MSLPRLRFERGPEQAIKMLRGMRERARLWERTAPRLHRFLLRRAEELFRTEGASEGARWPGYGGEPRWAAYKESLDVPLTRLRWEGGKERLYPSLTRAQHPEHVFRRTAKGISFGTRVPYASRLHQGGEKNPFGERIPARPLLVTGKKTTGKLGRMILMHVVQDDSTSAPWTD